MVAVGAARSYGHGNCSSCLGVAVVFLRFQLVECRPYMRLVMLGAASAWPGIIRHCKSALPVVQQKGALIREVRVLWWSIPPGIRQRVYRATHWLQAEGVSSD